MAAKMKEMVNIEHHNLPQDVYTSGGEGLVSVRGQGELVGGCLSLEIVSRSLSVGPSFISNRSNRCRSRNRNKLCPLMSYS